MVNNETTFNKAVRSDVYKIDPRAIKVIEGFNSRSDFGDIPELAAQIAEQGVLNPISVKKIDDEHYELIDGERRYRAVMYLIENGTDVARIPALVLPKNINSEAMLLQQIMRNEGKPFNEYEYGVAYQKFINLGFKIEEIAKKVGKKRWHIDCCLSHLRRDERVQKLLRENKIKGTEVRRIYQAYHNEEEAVKEILNLQELHKEKVNKGEAINKKTGETKTITVGDLDALSSKTIAKRDSAIIKKGIGLLLKYYNQVSENGAIDIVLDPVDVLEQLKADVDRTIIDILNDAKDEAMKPVA